MPRRTARRGRIAAAAMTSSTGASLGPSVLATAIEAAMSQAVMDCFAEGIVDDDAIRERKLAAREEVKAAFRRAEADAAEAGE
jgi:hypothetical protein